MEKEYSVICTDGGCKDDLAGVQGVFYSENMGCFLCEWNTAEKTLKERGGEGTTVESLENFLANLWGENFDPIKVKCGYDCYDNEQFFDVWLHHWQAEAACLYAEGIDFASVDDWYLELLNKMKVVILRQQQDAVNESFNNLLRELEPDNYDYKGDLKSGVSGWHNAFVPRNTNG